MNCQNWHEGKCGRHLKTSSGKPSTCSRCFIPMALSVAVYGDRFLDPYIKVDDPLIPALGDNYAYTKIEMEKLIQESGLSYSIFRLARIMEPATM